MKQMRVRAWVSVFSLLGAACGTGGSMGRPARTQTTYYPTGKRRIVAVLQDGQLQGRSWSYYPTGALESVSQWVGGQRTGVTRLYYANGVLRDSSAYVADSLHGRSLRYFRNGALKQRAWYTHGKQTGTTLFFDSLGTPLQREIYDAGGQLIYLNGYNRQGQASARGIQPILEHPDTIPAGQPMRGSIRFGYPLRAPATLVVGTLGTDRNAVDRYPVRDTVQVVQQSKDGRFYFAYPPARVGANVVGYKFLQPGSPWDAVPRQDSLSVDRLSGTSPFFVKPPTARRH